MKYRLATCNPFHNLKKIVNKICYGSKLDTIVFFFWIIVFFSLALSPSLDSQFENVSIYAQSTLDFHGEEWFSIVLI